MVIHSWKDVRKQNKQGTVAQNMFEQRMSEINTFFVNLIDKNFVKEFRQKFRQKFCATKFSTLTHLHVKEIINISNSNDKQPDHIIFITRVYMITFFVLSH